MNYSKEKIESLRHRWTTTKGKKLLKIIRDSRCYLSPVLFRDKVNNFPGINDEEVRDQIDLRGAPLSGFDFRVPVKEDDSGFSEDLAILSNIHFEGATLKYCNFQDGKIHECFFEDAELEHADFSNSTLSDCNFQEADCSGISLHGARLVNCNFNDTTIKDMSLESAVIDEKTFFGTALKSEKNGNYHFASIEYKQIKQIYKNSNLHNIYDHYHYKEMVAKRKTMHLKNPMRILNLIFGDLLCKYGTSFTRVMAWSAVIIVICAVLFTKYSSLLYHNTVVHPSFFDSLYFSTVSFTTLGYGDYHAVGFMRYIAALESFFGAALMSLFTVIVARQIIRD